MHNAGTEKRAIPKSPTIFVKCVGRRRRPVLFVAAGMPETFSNDSATTMHAFVKQCARSKTGTTSFFESSSHRTPGGVDDK